MIVDINIDALTKMGITAHQFIIARFVFEKRFIYLDHYLTLTKSNNNLSLDIGNLEKQGFLESAKNKDGSYDFKRFIFRKAFIENFNGYDLYDELYARYPSKVYRTDGQIDYLRVDRNKCKQLYSMIVGKDRSKHEHILKCLDAEVAHRRSNGSMKYMKRMSSWLNSEEWKSYEDRISDSVSTTENAQGYGENIE